MIYYKSEGDSGYLLIDSEVYRTRPAASSFQFKEKAATEGGL